MKIGLDTNLLVRYITNDNPEQANKVEDLFDSLSNDSTLVINQVVSAELDWVLTHVYDYSKEDFLKVIDQIFATQKITFSNPILVKEACSLYSKSKADFADCYLGIINADSGCETTYTFDKKASELAHFTLLN
jgi:predicted nucleic-acid-binding protein